MAVTTKRARQLATMSSVPLYQYSSASVGVHRHDAACRIVEVSGDLQPARERGLVPRGRMQDAIHGAPVGRLVGRQVDDAPIGRLRQPLRLPRPSGSRVTAIAGHGPAPNRDRRIAKADRRPQRVRAQQAQQVVRLRTTRPRVRRRRCRHHGDRLALPHNTIAQVPEDGHPSGIGGQLPNRHDPLRPAAPPRSEGHRSRPAWHGAAMTGPSRCHHRGVSVARSQPRTITRSPSLTSLPATAVRKGAVLSGDQVSCSPSIVPFHIRVPPGPRPIASRWSPSATTSTI